MSSRLAEALFKSIFVYSHVDNLAEPDPQDAQRRITRVVSVVGIRTFSPPTAMPCPA